MIGRKEGLYPDERAVERAIGEILFNQCSYTFVFCSSQNLDRLVSIYRAVKRHRKTLVIDLYTALILDNLGSISTNIPQFDWRGIRVLYGYTHAKKIAEYDQGLLYKYRESKINWDDIKSQPQDMVILARDNPYFRNPMLRKLEPTTGAKAIYSMWHGYLARSNIIALLEHNKIEMVEIHTSGHAYCEALGRLTQALQPKHLVPIHTFHPGQYSELFHNVVQLEDGEQLKI